MIYQAHQRLITSEAQSIRDSEKAAGDEAVASNFKKTEQACLNTAEAKKYFEVRARYSKAISELTAARKPELDLIEQIKIAAVDGADDQKLQAELKKVKSDLSGFEVKVDALAAATPGLKESARQVGMEIAREQNGESSNKAQEQFHETLEQIRLELEVTITAAIHKLKRLDHVCQALRGRLGSQAKLEEFINRIL